MRRVFCDWIHSASMPCHAKPRKTHHSRSHNNAARNEMQIASFYWHSAIVVIAQLENVNGNGDRHEFNFSVTWTCRRCICIHAQTTHKCIAKIQSEARRKEEKTQTSEWQIKKDRLTLIPTRTDDDDVDVVGADKDYNDARRHNGRFLENLTLPPLEHRHTLSSCRFPFLFFVVFSSLFLSFVFSLETAHYINGWASTRGYSAAAAAALPFLFSFASGFVVACDWHRLNFTHTMATTTTKDAKTISFACFYFCTFSNVEHCCVATTERRRSLFFGFADRRSDTNCTLNHGNGQNIDIRCYTGYTESNRVSEKVRREM